MGLTGKLQVFCTEKWLREQQAAEMLAGGGTGPACRLQDLLPICCSLSLWSPPGLLNKPGQSSGDPEDAPLPPPTDNLALPPGLRLDPPPSVYQRPPSPPVR